jgi:ABC transporter DrrB family efflux protein
MKSSAQASIRVADIRVQRGGREVLHGVDMEVRAGEIVGLLGPSGCGKTAVLGVLRERVGWALEAVGLSALDDQVVAPCPAASGHASRLRPPGTLERLMTLPLAKLDLLAGYGLAFGVLATVQAAISSAVAFWLLGLDVQSSALAAVGLAIANALLGMALGLLVSAFARTEFQAVQFMPAVVLPQILLCGLLVPRPDMAPALDAAGQTRPMTYAYDALHGAAVGQNANVGQDAAVVVVCIVLALALGAATLRRRTA